MKYVFALLFTVAVALGGLIGYVLNIVELCHATAFSGMIAARILGVIIPFVGAVLGWF